MICKACTEDKPVEEFYRSKNTKSGYRGSCKSCTNSQNAAWYENNKEKIRPVRKAYSEAHREESNERAKKWRESNPERAQEINRESYLRNREAVLERSQQRHADNPGYSGWKAARRRAIIRQNGGTFTYEELTNLFKTYGFKCINPDCEGGDARLTPDHVVPLALGGTNSIDNIQPLCLTCNLKKGTKTVDYRTSTCYAPPNVPTT